jgi:hypothetical protein
MSNPDTTTPNVIKDPKRNYFSAHEQFLTIQLRIKAELSAHLLWDRVLTPTQQKHLGGNFKFAYQMYGSTGIWMKLHGVTKVRATLDIAKILNILDENTHRWLMRETGELIESLDGVIAQVVPIAIIVFMDRPMQLFWRSALVDIDWTKHNACWTYLWELARVSKQGGVLDYTAFSRDYAKDYLTKMKSRLSQMPGVPAELIDQIVPAGAGSQQLDVPRDQIRMFWLEETQVVRECGTI